MLTPELQIELQALSYLMTTVIHRLHETDPAWWRETLKDTKIEREELLRSSLSSVRGDKVLQRAIAIVEHALAAEPPQKAKHGGGAAHDQ